jgi:hypothetical protein
MQVLQHEIDSLSRINDRGSFFDKCLIPQDILDKANAMAAAEGFSRHKASHLLKVSKDREVLKVRKVILAMLDLLVLKD